MALLGPRGSAISLPIDPAARGFAPYSVCPLQEPCLFPPSPILSAYSRGKNEWSPSYAASRVEPTVTLSFHLARLERIPLATFPQRSLQLFEFMAKRRE